MTQLAEISAALRAAVFTIFLPGLRFNSLSTELIAASKRSDLGVFHFAHHAPQIIPKSRAFDARRTVSAVVSSVNFPVNAIRATRRLNRSS